MTAILLTALFAASACLAIFAIVTSWRGYGREVVALRDTLRATREVGEMRITVREIAVRRSGGAIRRPDFTAAAARRRRPALQLPAAA